MLVQKLLQYLKNLNIESGISLEKQNFPDKQWLILAIATLSNGRDEIFNKDYVPPKNKLES